MPKVKTVICSECGREEPLQYIRDVVDKMIEKKLCFSCLFWYEKVQLLHDPRIVVVKGNCYFIGNEDSSYKGFGGDRFVIRFKDGREITTTNLWANGPVPPHFQGRLPDNAEFVKGVEVKKV